MWGLFIGTQKNEIEMVEKEEYDNINQENEVLEQSSQIVANELRIVEKKLEVSKKATDEIKNRLKSKKSMIFLLGPSKEAPISSDLKEVAEQNKSLAKKLSELEDENKKLLLELNTNRASKKKEIQAKNIQNDVQEVLTHIKAIAACKAPIPIKFAKIEKALCEIPSDEDINKKLMNSNDISGLIKSIQEMPNIFDEYLGQKKVISHLVKGVGNTSNKKRYPSY